MFDKAKPASHYSEPSASLPERKSKVYQAPTITPLDNSEPESGSSNVPETNAGVLES